MLPAADQQAMVYGCSVVLRGVTFFSPTDVSSPCSAILDAGGAKQLLSPD